MLTHIPAIKVRLIHSARLCVYLRDTVSLSEYVLPYPLLLIPFYL